MNQRVSGYERKPDESYETVAWPVLALLTQLGKIRRAWDPCNGTGRLVATLHDQGIEAVGTNKDFLALTEPPLDVSHLVTNPPYGSSRRGEEAVKFIEHALELGVPHVVMLLRNDFDSAISRQHLFRNCPTFAGKLVLLSCIKWFDGPSSPSDNHSWFCWPSIRYVTRAEAETLLGRRT